MHFVTQVLATFGLPSRASTHAHRAALVALLLATTLALPTRAQGQGQGQGQNRSQGLFADPVAAPELWTGQSRHYVIHTNLSREAIRPWAEHMDKVYEGFSQFLRGFQDRNRGQKQNLYLLNTREEYLATLQSFGIDGTGSGGMFFINGRARGLATYIGDQSQRRVFEVLQHEGFHQFASSRIGGNMPVWVNEGLATYFEQALVINGKFRHGLATRQRVESIRQAVKENAILPFDQLLDLNGQTWGANLRGGGPQGGMQYLQSWSIVHFLIHGDKGKYQQPFSQYLRMLSQGQTHDQAFFNAFGTNDRNAFRRRWEIFVEDQLTIDELTEALDRMNFLAQCTRLLAYEQGVEKIDGDKLFQTLIERGYQARTPGLHGQAAVTMSTLDLDVFGYTNDRGFPQDFVTRPSTDPKLPPTIAAEGLHPTPSVQWTVNEQGGLDYEITYSRR